MIEFVFIMPFLGFLMLLIFFFGWSMMNQQHVKTAARYAAWRHVIGPSDATGMGVNQSFFAQRADIDKLSIDYSAGPGQTLQDYAADVGAVDQQAGALARTLAVDTFPCSSQARIGAEFLTNVRSWQRFTGAIVSQCGREGVEWRRGQADLMQPMAEQFLGELNSKLDGIPGAGRSLGQVMRQLYLAQW